MTADMAGSIPDAAGEHVGDIDWTDPAGAGEVQDETGTAPEGEVLPAFISKDSFYSNFKMLFFVGTVVKFDPFPIASLAITPEEEAAARAASDVIYDIVAEITWLQFLLGENTVWAERASILLMFFGAKYLAVRAEIEARTVTLKAESEAHETRGGARGPAPAHSESAPEDTQRL